jgi:hypothetical protein
MNQARQVLRQDVSVVTKYCFPNRYFLVPFLLSEKPRSLHSQLCLETFISS